MTIDGITGIYIPKKNHGGKKNVKETKEFKEILAKQKSTSPKVSSSVKPGIDKIMISEKSRLHSLAKKELDKIDDIRKEKIEQIKKAITEGKYNVSPEDVAGKIINDREVLNLLLRDI